MNAYCQVGNGNPATTGPVETLIVKLIVYPPGTPSDTLIPVVSASLYCNGLLRKLKSRKQSCWGCPAAYVPVPASAKPHSETAVGPPRVAGSVERFWTGEAASVKLYEPWLAVVTS